MKKWVVTGVGVLAFFAPASAGAMKWRLSDLPPGISGSGPLGSVVRTGDVNGDGLADFAIEERPANDARAEVHVVFGGQSFSRLDLRTDNWRGFTIEGTIAGFPELTGGLSVGAAGDVNGDALADIVIGIRGASPEGRETAGAAYVVYGKRGETSVELDQLGDGGVTLIGAEGAPPPPPTGVFGDLFGSPASAAGDVNGDGIDDFAVGSPVKGIYVVLGGALPERIDMRDFDGHGWRIVRDGYGISATEAGDFNGDGLSDLLLPTYEYERGRVFVVFGSRALETVDLDDPGERAVGMEKDPEYNGEGLLGPAGFGDAGDAIGDFNFDGFGDVIVGAPASLRNAGRAYIVYGSASLETVQVDTLGDRGFALAGTQREVDPRYGPTGERFGSVVNGGFDLNSDGKPDFLVAAPYRRNDGPGGPAYVVYGGPEHGPFTGPDVPPAALRISGVPRRTNVAAPGDLTGNEREELVVRRVRGDVVVFEAPALLLGPRRQRLTHGKITIPMRCSPAEAACRGELHVTVRTARTRRPNAIVGSTSVDMLSGEEEGVAIRLNRRGRRLVRSRGSTRAKLVAELDALTQRERLRLLRPR